MLNEEVKFIHLTEIPERKKTNLEAIALPLTLTTGAIGGFLGAKHGLHFNNFFSFLLGAPTGIGLIAEFFHAVQNKKDRSYQQAYLKEEKRRDNEAKANASPSVQFTYRENDLECVIRPDYTKGHIFPMSINDGIIHNPTFSYQPQRNTPLTFRFAVPRFKEEKIKYPLLAAVDKMTGEMFDTKTREVREKSESSKLEYLAALKTKLEQDEKKLKINCQTRYEQDEKKFYAIITYAGEYHKDALQKFATLASSLMNHAKAVRAKEE